MTDEEKFASLQGQQDKLGKAFDKVSDKLDGITDTLQSLVRIEERQIFTSDRIGQMAGAANDRELRIRALEAAMPPNAATRLVEIEKVIPGLIESRKWMVAGLLAVVGAVGAAIAKGLLR